MKATLPLPLWVSLENPRSHYRSAPEESKLPRIEWVQGKGALLHPSPLAEAGEVLSLNLGQGCGQRCPFCMARAYPSYPGDDRVVLFSNTCDRLEQELASRRKLPRAVVVSPTTDPFPPLAEVQAEAIRVMEILAQHGVSTFFMTRGYIRPAAMKTLAQHRDLIRITMGMTTLNRSLQRILEPWTASPRLRLKQIAQLHQQGMPVQVAIEPLIPTLTDTRANLEPLLEALAGAGVQQITTGYLFLRPGIRDHLQKALEPHGWADQVLNEYEHGPMLHCEGIAAARYLPKVRRQRGYALLMSLAAGLGITVRISQLTNPDFRPEPTGHAPSQPRQRLLPVFEPLGLKT